MDDKRFHELERKRFGQGLTREEADELGRMMAERKGRRYSNADDREHPETVGAAQEQPYSETEQEELQEHPDVRGSEERAAS